MRRPRLIAFFSAFVTSALLLPAAALAWSYASHQAIGLAAESQLTSKTRAALARILQGTDTLSPGALAAVATWPDDLRAHARRQFVEGWGPIEIEEADAFNAAHPENGGWHFVDLPLGAGAYPATDPAPSDPLRPFVGPNDVVHAIRQAIAVLEAPTESPTFTRRQAVRFLVHLVGDLHQPMHVTSGFYDTTLPSFKRTPTRIDDPVNAARHGVFDDRGANGLLFSASEGDNLHSLWDQCLPAMVAGATCSGSVSYTVLANKLKGLMTPSAAAAATTPGDHHAWAAVWATESLQAVVSGRALPSSLKDGRVKLDSRGDPSSVVATVVAPSKNAYLANHASAARTQLVRAAVRLSALLNAIEWK